MGGCSPRKFLEIRCSEIASGAIFGQKQSRIATILSNFWLSYIHLLSQLTSTTEGTKAGRTVGVVTAIEEELVNSRAPGIAIYFARIYARS